MENKESSKIIGRKRDGVSSKSDSPTHARVDLDDSGSSSPEIRRVRNKTGDHNSTASFPVELDEPEVYLPESTKVPDDILDILDVPDVAAHELETIMKSFEEEILQPSVPGFPVVSLDLGYLPKASDDEHGLPPMDSQGKDQLRTSTEAPITYNSVDLDFGEFAFDDESLLFAELPETLHEQRLNA